MAQSNPISRRQLMQGLFGKPRPAVAEPPPPGPSKPQAAPMHAVIRAHMCLAATTECAACVERCPVAGAIVTRDRTPMVNPLACTGCGDCIAACPAPTGTIMLIPRRRRPANAHRTA